VVGHACRDNVTAGDIGRERRQNDPTRPYQKTRSGISLEAKHRMMMARNNSESGERAMAVADCPAVDDAGRGQGGALGPRR
jgi:hypothetical protein